MDVRLTHIDGVLPNLALMKLASWHLFRGDRVYLTRELHRGLFELEYDVVYASAIFGHSARRVEVFRGQWPDAVVGGTGSGESLTVEDVIGQEWEDYDYSVYPWYEWSIGFTQRGCRMKCKFCVVPEKEGKPRVENTISEIWRAGTPRNVVLLDNDFFGQPEAAWRARIGELVEGGFRVNFNQGVNVRLITKESSAALASVNYYDRKFKRRRLYTAWDNLGDEKIFERGAEMLFAAGVKPEHVMVYMLVGYDPKETWERIFSRFDRLVAMGVLPYPMVYNNLNPELKAFQKWVVRGLHHHVPWEDYRDPRLKSAAG